MIKKETTIEDLEDIELEDINLDDIDIESVQNKINEEKTNDYYEKCMRSIASESSAIDLCHAMINLPGTSAKEKEKIESFLKVFKI